MAFLVREAEREDVEHILSVAQHLDSLNLPAKRDDIEHIVELSERSFAHDVSPEEREYLFVLEDTSKKRVVGTSMIHGQHGTRRAPHIYFQVGKEERYSETLDRYFVHQTLKLGYDYDGPTEIGGLILDPAYRGHPLKLGKLLSYVRFVFIAAHRAGFRDRVLSELLPPLEKDGTSRLWEHLGRRFTGLSYQEADKLSRTNKEFIRTLFPHGAIYSSLFPEEVRELIGEVGPETKGVERMLRSIGFRYAKHIDPFDGGPHFVANTDDISLVRNSSLAEVTTGEESGVGWGIVAKPSDGFRAIVAPVTGAGSDVVISSQCAETLRVEKGAECWVLPG